MSIIAMPKFENKRFVNEVVGLRPFLVAVGLLALFSLLLAYVQFGTSALAGTDGYYHMKMAYLMRQEGLKPLFTYLPLTILNETAFYDHHMLYHLYLSLFATTDPVLDGGAGLTQGAKLASIFLPALTFVAVWALLRRQRVLWPSLWALGLFIVSEPFLYRMSMPRAQSVSLLLLVLAMMVLLNGRFWLLLPLGFAFVWFYNAFPLLLVVTAVYIIATLATERRLLWQPLLLASLGIGLGLIINPYFPQNITFITQHLLPKVGESAVKVGNEWNPYQTWTLVENSWGALILLVLAIGALGWHDKRMNKATLFAFGLVIVFGYMLFKSRRFVEYFPAFVLIFAALAISPLLRQWVTDLRWKRPYLGQLLPFVLFLLLLFPLRVNLGEARGLMARAKPADQYADAALWLNENAPQATIFQTDWDDFTRLFFYNSDAVYTAGLDPTFMQLHDDDLFETWVDITKGRVAQPATLIRDRFNADYVFTDLKHENFIEEAEADPHLNEVYRDQYAIIYAVEQNQ